MDKILVREKSWTERRISGLKEESDEALADVITSLESLEKESLRQFVFYLTDLHRTTDEKIDFRLLERYRRLKEHWNNSYATEASLGLLKYGFSNLGLKKIVSSAHVDNIASRRVMEKIRMPYIDSSVHYGCLQVYYEIEHDAYTILQKAIRK